MHAHRRRFLALVVVVSLLCGGSAGVAKEDPGFVRITPAEVQWRDIPDSHGVQQAILSGDPEKPGMYVVRVRFPPHVMDAPHWHPNARYVTDGSAGNEPVMVQIIGEGPAQTVQVDPKQPMWIEVAR
jgi:hypothetical protein